MNPSPTPVSTPKQSHLLSRAGAGIRERMANLVGSKEDAATSPGRAEEGGGRLSARGSLMSRRSMGAAVASPSPVRPAPAAAASGLSPRDEALECRVTVLLPSGGSASLRLAKTCKVDQVKAKLFAAAEELAGLPKDQFVLATAGPGGRRFQVEFQRLAKADPALEALVEGGGPVELVLLPVESRTVTGGTPAMTRRWPGGRESGGGFSTPQAARKTLSPRPAGVSVTPSPGRKELGPQEQRRRDEEEVRQKREALEQKKRAREEQEAAAQLKVLEQRQRESDRLAASRDEEQQEEVRRQQRKAEADEEARRVAAAALAQQREHEAAEARLQELERRQRQRDSLVLSSQQTAAELERERRRHQEEQEREEQRAAIAEEERRMELERRQRERERLLLEVGTPSPDGADDTAEEARLQSLRELSQKKLEVEEKRAELERKMREVEERQRVIERRRQERLEEERETEEEEQRRRQQEEAAAAARRREEQQRQRDAELEAHDAGESVWTMLREKQLAEEAKRKQLSEERAERERLGKKQQQQAEDEEAARKRRLAEDEEAARKRRMAEDEDAARKRRVAEAADELRRWKEEEQKRAAAEAVASAVAAEEEKEKEKERQRRLAVDEHKFAASMPVLTVDSCDEGSPVAKAEVDSPSSGRKKHQRTGSFGFLRGGDKLTPPSGERASASGDAKKLAAAAAGEKKGTPLLSRISQGVKGVRSVLVQRRNSFRSAKPLGARSEPGSGPDDFPAHDEIGDEDDLAIFALSHEAVRRCTEDAERAERARGNLRELATALVAGKCKTSRAEYCTDNKFYWIESTYSDFDSEWRNPDNMSLLLPHLDDTVYADRIRRVLHKNYFAMDEKVGPIVLTHSLVADGDGDFCHILWSDSGLREFKVAAALYNQLPAQGDLKQRLRLVQKVLETFFLVSPATRLTLAVRESFNDELDSIEHSLHSSNYKFGVLFAKEGQSQNEMFGNREPSAAFERFLSLLGERVELRGFTGFRGGLDVKHGHTGTESVYTRHAMVGGSRRLECDIMFHVSTMLPYSESDAQQLERKRHLGNDIVVIVFLEGDGAVPYDPNVLKSEFNHAFVIVQPLGGGGAELYRVHCIYKSGVPECNPFMPGPDTLFSHGPDFRAWLLAKCINAERASCQCTTFSQKLRRTRRLQTQMLVNSVLEESEKSSKA